jgi:hypothetical protein
MLKENFCGHAKELIAHFKIKRYRQGSEILPATRGDFFQYWKFFPRHAATFSNIGNSSRDTRQLFPLLEILSATRGSFFHYWKFFPQHAATFSNIGRASKRRIIINRILILYI